MNKFSTAAAALALFLAVATGSAAASYVLSSNAQIGPNTISGNNPPAGDHANLLAGSIAASDLAAHGIGSAQLATVEAWNPVAQDPSAATDPCHQGRTAVFCVQPGGGAWANAGGNFTPAGFYRDLEGRVHLRGLVSFHVSGRVPATPNIFILPTGYRPTHELVFATVDNDSGGSYLARVDVMPDGTIYAHKSRLTFLSLDGVSFQAGE